MSDVRRSAVVPAAPERVWEVLADAYTLPRWWPGITRVEGVREIGFTAVLMSRKGRTIRLDLLYTEVEEPTRLAWTMEVSGSQFERLLTDWSTRFTLAPDAGGTRVTIEEHQRFRGSLRTGALIQARAARQRLDGALAGLGEFVGG